jgi:hypothetical protein
MKSFEQLEKALELIFDEKAVNKTNKKGISHANSLIENGDVKFPENWERPSVEMENKYLEENGWAKLGQWYLGVDTSMDVETKGHYGYIYTSDFKTVDRQGLRAIRQRSAQNGLTGVFAAAGKMIDKIDSKEIDA